MYTYNDTNFAGGLSNPIMVVLKFLDQETIWLPPGWCAGT